MERPSGSGGFSHQDDIDLRGAADHAAKHSNMSENPDFFSSILNQLGSNKDQIAGQRIDEEAAIRSHKDFYGTNPTSQSQASSTSSATNHGIGTAAAMEALKLFTSGGASQSTSQNAFIGLAMSQAAKLFDQQSSRGNLASEASKESAVMKAGEMALQMFLRSQMDSAPGNKFPGAGAGPAGLGSENSLGGLLTLAGKLMEAHAQAQGH
ncbi:hypothetical protein V8F20_006288 [Naviculisporaceae sp. PSN 640]